MDFKKVGVCSILFLLLLPLISSFVLAQSTVSVSATTSDSIPLNQAAEDAGMPSYLNPAWNILNYVFGGVSQKVAELFTPASSIIVTLAIWVMILVTFGDILATFSTFSKPVSWILGVLLAIIAANFKIVVLISAAIAVIFIPLGVIGVWLGISAAFAVFIIVNLGISSAGKWVMKRKAMIKAATAEAGGERLAGAIKGFGQAGKALEKLGS